MTNEENQNTLEKLTVQQALEKLEAEEKARQEA